MNEIPKETDTNSQENEKIIPERGREIALARVDVIRIWQDFSHGKIDSFSISQKKWALRFMLSALVLSGRILLSLFNFFI